MASSNSIPSKNDIYFELDNPEQYYSPGEALTGQLVIAANTSIDVQALAVSLESVSESCVVDKNNKKQTENHYLVYQLCEINPMSDITNLTTSAPAAASVSTAATPAVAPPPAVAPSTAAASATSNNSGNVASETTTTTATTLAAAPQNLSADIPAETSTDRGLFSSTKFSSFKSKKQSSTNTTSLQPGFHRFRFQLSIPLKGHCYVTSRSSKSSAEKELQNHVSRFLPSSLSPSETPLLIDNSNIINYYLKSIIKRNVTDSSQDVVTCKELKVRTIVDLNDYKGYECRFQEESILKLPEFGVEVPIILNISSNTPNLAIVESYNESSQSLSIDFESFKFQIFSKLDIPQLVKFGSPIASKQINTQVSKIEIFSNFKVLAGNDHTSKSESLCVLNSNCDGIQFPLSTFENVKSSSESFGQVQSLKVAKFDNVVVNKPSKLIQSFTTCNLKQEYYATITFSITLVPTNKSEVCAEQIPVFTSVSVPVELYYRECLGSLKNSNGGEEPSYILYNNSKLYYKSNASMMPNNLNNKISKYEGVASEISESLSGKLNKLSMKLGKENPKLGNKFSHYVNEGNQFVQHKLGNDEFTSASSSNQPLFDNKVQEAQSSTQNLSSSQNHVSSTFNSSSTPTATLTSPAPQPGPSIAQTQAPAYNTATSVLLESGTSATGDVKASNFDSSAQAVVGKFSNEAGTSVSTGVYRPASDESELPAPPSYDESLHSSLSDIKSNDTK